MRNWCEPVTLDREYYEILDYASRMPCPLPVRDSLVPMHESVDMIIMTPANVVVEIICLGT
jgi:hypothetical protein